MSNNNGRARDGSEPGLTGLSGIARDLVRMAQAVAGMEAETETGCESPGVALRAQGRPEGGPVLVVSADREGAPVRVLRFVGPVLTRAREVNVSRLAAAADDAAELAEAFGRDARLALAAYGLAGTVKRYARLAFRLAEECRRLRALADAVQEEAERFCVVCGEREAEHGGQCLRCAFGGER